MRVEEERTGRQLYLEIRIAEIFSEAKFWATGMIGYCDSV
jgi:hypothetical protein